MIDLSVPAPSPEPWRRPETWWGHLSDATATLSAPVGVIAEDALAYNARDLVVRAAGLPIRVASKSIRVRAVLDAVLALPGYRGILAYTLSEALWLAADHDDIVVGYPSVDREALRQLIADEQRAQRVTIMIDDEAHLDLIDQLAPPSLRPTIRVAIDVDASWRTTALGHIGVRRSPLSTPGHALTLARRVVARPGFVLVGLMMYEAQIAGQGDATGHNDAIVRWMQSRSIDELRVRRGAIVDAVSEIAALEFVNGGGTGSMESTAADPAVTEVTAGSGLLGGHLFDGYRAFRPAPAAAFACDVVRRPSDDIATLLGGGWVASGPASSTRLPVPVWPSGLRYLPREGAGEVQTPVQGPNARHLRIGDRVWLRHAKSGEASEHLASYALVRSGTVAGDLPTYRGEGKAFL